MGCTADHAPLAQRWKDVPPIQFHMPSVVQAPVKPPVEPLEPVEPVVSEELEPDGAAGATLAAALGLSDETAIGATEGAPVAVTAVGEAAAALDPAVTTAGSGAAALDAPPVGIHSSALLDSVGAAVRAAVVAAVVATEAAAEVAMEAVPEAAWETAADTVRLADRAAAEEIATTVGEDVPVGAAADAAAGPEPAAAVAVADPPAATVGLLQPVGGLAEGSLGPLRSYSTESPGSGNIGSVSETVAQLPLTEPMLALNISGNVDRRLNHPKLDRLTALRVSMPRFAAGAEPVTVTGAQFMYISLLPTLLNHVQASVYCPG